MDLNTASDFTTTLIVTRTKIIWQKGESFVFVRWQHETDVLAVICNFMFWLGFDP